VVDSITAVNLAPGATVRVTEGTFSDTLFAFPPGSASAVYGGVHERAGVYDVTVTHPAYTTWQRSSVRVRRDECHVIAEVFTARLRPKP
jgi:hypothetical protein